MPPGNSKLITKKILLHGYNPEDIIIISKSKHLVNRQIYLKKRGLLNPPENYARM